MKKSILTTAIIGMVFTYSCKKGNEPQPTAQKQTSNASVTLTTPTVNVVDSLKDINWYAYKQEIYTNGSLTNSHILIDTSTFTATNWLQKLGYTNYDYSVVYTGYTVIKIAMNGKPITSQPFDTLKLNIVNDSMITFTTGVSGGQYNKFYYKK